MINIYIGLSNNQIANCELILETGNNKNDHNVLVSNKTLIIKSDLWDEIILSDKTFNNQPKNILSSLKIICDKIKEYKKIVFQLKKYKNTQNVTLYFSFIEDILSNYLLLSFNKNLKGIVVEDGMLNYYSHTIKNIPVKKRYLKWFFSNIMFLRYKIYQGHSSGIEYRHVLKQYVRIPKLTLFPEKSVLIPYSEKEIELSKTILIVGQEPYINMYGLDSYLEALNRLFDVIKSETFYENIKIIYYKPHRHGKRINYEKVQEIFLGKNLVILDSDEGLEDIYFNKIKSKHIYSFDSSALLNIYIESCLNTRQKIKFNVLMKYNIVLESIFKKFKFKIYR